jgi:N-acetyl-gamma-glutamyl-phosphate reductase
MEQTLTKLAGTSAQVTFVPHLLPINRGILATCYAWLEDGVTEEQLRQAYESFYQDEFFVRVLPKGMVADLKNVRCSNFVDISIHVDEEAGLLVAISAIDNMVKGAAGQAVQNMNLVFGLDEKTGLTMVPPAF